MHTEAVSNIVSRSELLCAASYILAFLAYRRISAAGSAAAAAFWFAAAMAGYAAAVLTKETGLTLLALLALLDLLPATPPSPPVAPSARKYRAAAACARWAALGGATAAYLAWKRRLTGPQFMPHITSLDNAAAHAPTPVAVGRPSLPALCRRGGRSGPPTSSVHPPRQRDEGTQSEERCDYNPGRSPGRGQGRPPGARAERSEWPRFGDPAAPPPSGAGAASLGLLAAGEALPVSLPASPSLCCVRGAQRPPALGRPRQLSRGRPAQNLARPPRQWDKRIQLERLLCI